MNQIRLALSAVILAGGESRRMGREKSWLESSSGKPLLARQIGLAQAAGAEEVMISGRGGVNYSAFGCPVLLDRWPGCGPLAGIERGLAACRHSLLLVLAVDMPLLEVDFLDELLRECAQERGVVPMSGSRMEPLIAVYPKAALQLALRALESGDYAVHKFASLCANDGLVRFVQFPPAAARQFTNWNSPEDIATTTRSY